MEGKPMRLSSVLEINAGGPGSGCHGENCGRPSTANSYASGVAKVSKEDFKEIKAIGQEGTLMKSEHPFASEIWTRIDDAAYCFDSIGYNKPNKGEGFTLKNSEGKIVGAMELDLHYSSSQIEVKFLASHPKVITGELKEKGIGTRLLIQAAKTAAEQGKGLVLTSLARAVGFYQKMGMQTSIPGSFYWTAKDCQEISKGTDHWS
jgi:GNAT superfamily N-acetyltransferase